MVDEGGVGGLEPKLLNSKLYSVGIEVLFLM